MSNINTKRISVLILILASVFLCTNAMAQDTDDELFRILSGKWTGQYVYQNGIDKNSWVMDRWPDGTYDLHVQQWRNNELKEEHMSHGNWWIKKSVFYSQLGGGYHNPDIYRMELKSENEIVFIEQLNEDKTTEFIDGYKFTDYRVFM